jgi:hypothetical protein
MRYKQDIEYSLFIQEAKYVESWPNTTFPWAGCSRFDIPWIGMVEYIPS